MAGCLVSPVPARAKPPTPFLRLTIGGQGGTGEEACVDDFQLVDLTFGYELPSSGATLQLTVSNLFDTGYRNFVGVPEIGRVLMARIKYDIF